MKTMKGLRELAAPGVIIALVGLNLLQTNSLRQEIAAVRYELGGRIDDLSARVDILTGRVDALSARVDVLSSRVDDLSGRVDDLSGRVDDLSGRVDVLNSRVDDLNRRVDDLNVRVTKLEVRQELRLQLENRFEESDEGLEQGGPRAAADRLLVRAGPEIDAALASRNGDYPSHFAYELAAGLWEQRAQILARDVDPRLQIQ